jgi:hypothetical protein
MASRVSLTTKHRHDASQFSNLLTGSEKTAYAGKSHGSGSVFNHFRNMERGGQWGYISLNWIK